MDPIVVGAVITAVAQIVAAGIVAVRRRRESAPPPPPPRAPDEPFGIDPVAYRPPRSRSGRNGVRPVLLGYVFGVTVLTLALLAYLYREFLLIDYPQGFDGLLRFWTASIHWDPNPVRLLVFWFGLTAGFCMLTETLPKGGATTTVASVPDLAALLMFGPPTAAVLVGITDLIANVGKSPLRVTFNFFQIMATVMITGLIYSACGGKFGDEISLHGISLLALVIAPFVYFSVNTLLVTTAIRLRERISWLSAWRRNFEWQVPHVFFLLLPFGALLALCQVHFGIPGALLCSLTVVFAHFSFRAWNQNRSARFETVRMIVSEIDRTDPSTVDHSNRIAAYSVRVAWELGVSTHEADDIEFAALFHNLGTIAIKHVFLMENRKLTDKEERSMRRHPEIGYHLLMKVPLLHRAAEIIYCHQERLDGEGYPRGLREEDIPLGSQIILAVDAFDAMISGRAHRPKGPPEQAYEELRENAGTQFSARVVETLISLHEENRLDEELDAGFRQEQARQRYGLRMFKYRAARRARLAWTFFRRGLLVLFGGGDAEDFTDRKAPSGVFEKRTKTEAEPAPPAPRESRKPAPRPEPDPHPEDDATP
jgi:HD-GYP domain-containing protein (c-di-GMP phosphodiesterase class II)